MSDHGRVWIGTSGWVYKHWLGIFYPPKMPGAEQLAFYAQHFDTVEINYSYYQLPTRAAFEQWRTHTPPGFLFAAKASRYLTHMKKLKDPEEPLQRLMERAGGLEEKLGPILFQFPHTWHANPTRLAAFAATLRAYPQQRFAFEFRHRTWLSPDVYRLLEEVGAALCLPVSPTVPVDIQLTAPWTYIRMHTGQHGIGFGEEELALWADRIRSFRREGVAIYVYFNNDPGGHAIRDAQRLTAMLNA